MNVAPFVLNALDYLDQGITVIDGRLRVVMWNRHMMDLLGFPPSMMRVGMSLEALIRFNAERGEYGDGDIDTQVDERMALARQFKSHCFERRRPNGTIIEVKGNPLADGGFVTVYSDITQRREHERALESSAMELENRVRERTASLHLVNRELREEIRAHQKTADALRENEQWLRTITDSIPVLIAYLDQRLKCRFTNQRAIEWFGSVNHAGNGDDPSIARRQAFVDTLAIRAQDALGGHTVNQEVEFHDCHGAVRVASVDLVPHFAAEGNEVQGLFLLAQDVTRHKITQAALLESGKLNAVGQLTGALAHDFGNMLAIVQGNLAFMQQLAGDGDRDMSDSLASCLRTIDRGAELTRRLLAFARRQSLQPQTIDMRRLLKDFCALTRHPLGEKVQVQVRVERDTVGVHADPSGLENTLLNLVFNARDALPDGGRIRIAACNVSNNVIRKGQFAVQPGNYVRLRISDNGTGIDPEHLPHVMEPFFTTKRIGGGTGLGLSTVYGFVKQSSGDIRIDSSPGKGTCVDILLPAACDTQTMEKVW